MKCNTLHEKYSNYRYCTVRECKNTSIKTPGKLWIRVPSETNTRNTWLNIAGRDPATLSTAQIYFCEDHFDLPNDMENYMRYHVMGSVSHVRLIPGCVPSKFQRQPDRKQTSDTLTSRQYVVKKQRKMVIEEKEKVIEQRTSIATKQLELGVALSGSSGPPGAAAGATCGACRDAIPASAALFRCVQCAGRALLCARCLPLDDRHRAHCVMRLPSTRVHGILEGLLQKLRLDVTELLSKEDNPEGPIARDPMDEPLVEVPSTSSDRLPSGLDITEPSGSQYAPLEVFIKEEDPLKEDRSPKTESPSPETEATVAPKKRKRKVIEKLRTSTRVCKRAAVAREPPAVASRQRVDTSGKRDDASGQRYDASRQRYDASGQRDDASGQCYDASGQCYDASGQHDEASGRCDLVPFKIKQEPLLPGEINFEEQMLEVHVKQESIEDDAESYAVYQRKPGDGT